MFSKVNCAGLSGTEGFIVKCETDVSDGLPSVNLIGQLAPEVRESHDRVKTALRNSGYYIAPSKITINLSPGDIRKQGCGYDLAIAISILLSAGNISIKECSKLISDSVFIGELSLDGKLNRVNGILSMTIAARDAGYENIFVPYENVLEASVITGINSYGIKDLKEIIDILQYDLLLPERTVYKKEQSVRSYDKDFSDVCGQSLVKRASVIAVAGRHNILYIGPAGTGKSMIASRIPTIMPEMSTEEQIEISKMYSINGLLKPDEPLLRERPFRSPHHTISQQALCGGGAIPKPGEISLASGGVLFLDELAEFKSSTLDGLRQPLEEKKVVISRVNSSLEFPSDFVLVAATNPCKCGFYPDRSRCSCSESMVRSYLGKISKPILDRIDICVEMPNPAYRELKEIESGKRSSELRKEVERVRLIQEKRFKEYGIHFNSEMSSRLVKQFCSLSDSDDEFLKNVYAMKGMSARGLNKILKVARTIADLENNASITRDNLCEAINYRSLEEKYLTGGEVKIEDKFRTKTV